jgi:hypothetical protein
MIVARKHVVAVILDTKNPSFIEHSISPIMNVGLQLLARRVEAENPSDYDALGSAIMIRPELAITAKHVIEDYIKKYGATGHPNNLNTNFSLSAFQIICKETNDVNATAVMYGITKLVLSPLSDLALLHLSPLSRIPDDLDRKTICISLTPPNVGDQVVAFGYHKGEIELDSRKTGVIRQPATSVGEVIEIKPKGRPLVSWPHFITNALYEGGMSGGPVLNDKGALCGIITTCMKGDETSPHYSSVSLLAPFMFLSSEFQLPGDTNPKIYTMYDLAERGFLNIDGLEKYEIMKGPDGSITSMRTKIPSEKL